MVGQLSFYGRGTSCHLIVKVDSFKTSLPECSQCSHIIMLTNPPVRCDVINSHTCVTHQYMNTYSTVNVAAYLSPAACPASGNLAVALRCRTEESKNAHSASWSPPRTPLDTSCPQLCPPAEHNTGRKRSQDRIMMTVTSVIT